MHRFACAFCAFLDYLRTLLTCLLNSRTVSPFHRAASLAHLPGLVFLDTALPDSSARSYITAAPAEIIAGNINRDWQKVVNLLLERTASASAGGLFGWVGFDGEFVFGDYAHVLVFEHASRSWRSSSDLMAECRTPKAMPPPPPLKFEQLVTREAYTASVRRAQEYIAAGDIYQVNLSLPWTAHWSPVSAPLSFYQRLRKLSPAPHAAYLDIDGTRLFCSSPESFLHISGRDIRTRPIKGTRPRHPRSPAKDRASAAALIASAKERAELLMITDLERNDLGQVCEYGSIQVPELASVESFAQVFHLVSTITGTLRAEVDHATAFKACFPGGSITGAPKRRALEIIHELEQHPRGIYTGAIGYFGYDGESRFNIVIRTAIQRDEHITFHTGAGIVADSVPDLEYDETLHKAAGILRAAGHPLTGVAGADL